MSGNENYNGSTSRWWATLWTRRRRPEQYLAPYRRLALQLHHDLPRRVYSRSVLLATPSDSNLCAHGSVVLARCLGEELRRPVLLIDFSSTSSEVSSILGCAGNRGCIDVLSDPKLPLDELVLPTTRENVFFLPAGVSRDASPLASPEDMSAFLKAAESRYDFVLLSGGSVLDDSSALAVAPYVGRVLLLVVENETRVEDLDAAHDALSFCNASKVGLLLTTPVRRSGTSFAGKGPAHKGSKRRRRRFDRDVQPQNPSP